MKKIVVTVLLIAALARGVSAKTAMLAPNPILVRVAASDRVVIGKVSDIADKTVPADLFKGDTRKLQITTVTVEEALLGKKTKTIKVGSVAPVPGGVGGPFLRGRPGITLSKDQEAMFFLTRHPTKKDVYLATDYFDVVIKTGNSNFGDDCTEVRRCARLLANKNKGLESKDARERLETVAMLIMRCRTGPVGGTATEPVPAGESKKILTALAEADWNTVAPRNSLLSPRILFFSLGVTSKDGWSQPKDFTQLVPEAKKWLKDNAGTYKMKRYVRARDEKIGLQPEPQ